MIVGLILQEELRKGTGIKKQLITAFEERREEIMKQNKKSKIMEHEEEVFCFFDNLQRAKNDAL